MANKDKVQLTINLINNDEKNLICNCCSRPILVKNFDEIIDLNYKETPEFFKINLKNEWIKAYDNLNKSNLPLNKLPRRLDFIKWNNLIKTDNWVSTCNLIIEKLISNEELNLTDEDEKNFREELNLLIRNNNEHTHKDSHNHEHSHEHNHEHNHEDKHEHSHNNSLEHNI